MTDAELADLDDLLGDGADDTDDRDGDGALDYLDDDEDDRRRVPAFDPFDIGPPDFRAPDFGVCPFELELAEFERKAGVR